MRRQTGLNLWLLVPVKPFDEGKSRLASELNDTQRSDLSRRLLERLLSLARATELFTGILVVSRDDDVFQVAADAGVAVLHESGYGLNTALDAAREQVLQWGAEAIVVLPADLPWVTEDDLLNLVSTGRDGSIVLAPSQDGGTNALFLRPPSAIEFFYGKGSARRHVDMAEERGLSVVLLESPTLAFDIDSPVDLQRLTVARGA